MYLAAYYFDGDPTALLAAYDRYLASDQRESVDLHVCVTQAAGIVVLDACPDRATFDGFRQSPDFHTVLRAAGLPAPRIEGIGDVHSVRACPKAATP